MRALNSKDCRSGFGKSFNLSHIPLDGWPGSNKYSFSGVSFPPVELRELAVKREPHMLDDFMVANIALPVHLDGLKSRCGGLCCHGLKKRGPFGPRRYG